MTERDKLREQYTFKVKQIDDENVALRRALLAYRELHDQLEADHQQVKTIVQNLRGNLQNLQGRVTFLEGLHST